jgi:hypothetical protein
MQLSEWESAFILGHQQLLYDAYQESQRRGHRAGAQEARG